MAKWKKSVYKLDANHKWKAKPGNQIFVADWGAVRFDIPRGWIPAPGDRSVKLHDKEPPEDTCTLQVTVFHLPPIDWSDLHLDQMLEESLSDATDGVISRGEIVYERRGDLELAWVETRFTDPNELREARSRTCIARRASVQALITFDFWPEDIERLGPVWDEVLRTLELAEPAIRR